MMTSPTGTRRGFTLVEVILVAMVLGMLMMVSGMASMNSIISALMTKGVSFSRVSLIIPVPLPAPGDPVAAPGPSWGLGLLY